MGHELIIFVYKRFPRVSHGRTRMARCNKVVPLLSLVSWQRVPYFHTNSFIFPRLRCHVWHRAGVGCHCPFGCLCLALMAAAVPTKTVEFTPYSRGASQCLSHRRSLGTHATPTPRPSPAAAHCDPKQDGKAEP